MWWSLLGTYYRRRRLAAAFLVRGLANKIPPTNITTPATTAIANHSGSPRFQLSALERRVVVSAVGVWVDVWVLVSAGWIVGAGAIAIVGSALLPRTDGPASSGLGEGSPTGDTTLTVAASVGML